MGDYEELSETIENIHTISSENEDVVEGLYTGYVYLLTNIETSQHYVGMTTKNVEVRWEQHLSLVTSGQHRLLYQAINEYGSECFTKQVLEVVQNNDKSNLVLSLFKREAYWIEEKKAYESGYNMTRGNPKWGNSVKAWRYILKNRQKFPCSSCSWKSCTEQALAIHNYKIHNGQKPFPCERCDTRFADNGARKTHVSMVHLGITPFECTQCDRVFCTNLRRKQHEDMTHNKTSKYVCEKCNCGFFDSPTLKGHILSCTGEGKRCPRCSKYIRTEIRYMVHQAVHKGRGVCIDCPECGKSFETAGSLTNHYKLFHGWKGTSVVKIEHTTNRETEEPLIKRRKLSFSSEFLNTCFVD